MRRREKIYCPEMRMKERIRRSKPSLDYFFFAAFFAAFLRRRFLSSFLCCHVVDSPDLYYVTSCKKIKQKNEKMF